MRSILVTLLFVSSFYVLSNEQVVTLTTHNIDYLGAYPVNTKIKPIADKTFTGKSVDTLRCTFNKLPYTLKILVMPWKRAQLTVEMKQADGFFSASKNAERDQFATFSAPLHSQNWVWYYKEKSNITPTKEHFKSLAKVGAYSGSNMTKWLSDNGYNTTVNTTSPKDLLQALKIGRINTILANDRVINSVIDTVDIKLDSHIHSERPLGVYFSKDFLKSNSTFLDQFNLKLSQCTNEDTRFKSDNNVSAIR